MTTMKLIDLLDCIPSNTVVCVQHAIEGVKYTLELTAGEIMSDERFMRIMQVRDMIVVEIRAMKRNKIKVTCL